MTFANYTVVELDDQQVQCPESTPVDIVAAMKMGERVKKRMGELGWKQTRLLDEVAKINPDRDRALTIPSLSAIIRRKSVRSEWSELIARALGVTHLWLTTGADPKFPPDHDDSAPQGSGIAPWPLPSIPPERWALLDPEVQENIDAVALTLAGRKPPAKKRPSRARASGESSTSAGRGQAQNAG